MQEQITVSYVLNKRLKTLLQQWAEQNDRTVSAELRQILEREAERREQGHPIAQKSVPQQCSTLAGCQPD
jgi:hypothetical protein